MCIDKWKYIEQDNHNSRDCNQTLLVDKTFSIYCVTHRGRSLLSTIDCLDFSAFLRQKYLSEIIEIGDIIGRKVAA